MSEQIELTGERFLKGLEAFAFGELVEAIHDVAVVIEEHLVVLADRKSPYVAHRLEQFLMFLENEVQATNDQFKEEPDA